MATDRRQRRTHGDPRPRPQSERARSGGTARRCTRCSTDSEQRFAETGHYHGVEQPGDAGRRPDPLREDLLAAARRHGHRARDRAEHLRLADRREIGEICFALYTPEGDNVTLSTGIIVHVHTMSEAIKFMVRNDWEDNPEIRPGDIFANNQPTIGDVHNADVQNFVPIFNPKTTAS